MHGVILGLETLVSSLAFCKFAPLPLRRHLDPILGLHFVPLCLSSLCFLKIHFSSFQLSHFPPPPPLLLDTPGSRKEPCPKSLAPPGQLFSKCQTLRNVGSSGVGSGPESLSSPVSVSLCFPFSLRSFNTGCSVGTSPRGLQTAWSEGLLCPTWPCRYPAELATWSSSWHSRLEEPRTLPS